MLVMIVNRVFGFTLTAEMFDAYQRRTSEIILKIEQILEEEQEVVKTKILEGFLKVQP